MESYHDYAIKDGKLIAKYEEMYQKFDDPWIQSTQPNKYSRSMAIINIKRFGIKSIVEYGCGLGYYADWVHRETGIIPRSIDISPSAIAKAKVKFPHLNFEVGNIMDLDLIENKESVDCILLADIMWYILDSLDEINEKLMKNFQGKYLINNFVTYRDNVQKYGREYFTSTQEFIDYMPFKLIGYGVATTIEDPNIDSTTIFKIEPK